MRKGHVARRRWEEIFHLNQVGTIWWYRREKRGKEKKRKNKESGVGSSTIFLGSTKIGSSIFVGVRGKVHLRDESFA